MWRGWKRVGGGRVACGGGGGGRTRYSNKFKSLIMLLIFKKININNV